MFAVRAARAFTGRDGIIKMEGGTSCPVCGVPESAGIPRRVGQDLFIAPFNDLTVVEDILQQHAEEIAAIIVEPVLGGLGIIAPLLGYLTGLRHLASEYGVLLIFYEVQTLRLALGGAQEKYGVTPDLTAAAKIMGGGLPIGVFGGRADIMASFDPTQPGFLLQSGTFSDNRASMAGVIAAMNLLDAAAIDKLEQLGARLEAGMTAAIRRFGIPASVNRMGSLLHLHMTLAQPTNYVRGGYRPGGRSLHRSDGKSSAVILKLRPKARIP